ncbi:MAG: TlyA family RNA methyltransferase [Burkholderiaceae bacterium]|nr:TlyA family RNA methyltransferase [Burkholderiaceae bacterium]
MRADRLLVARGLAPSRTLAQRLIDAGRVRAGEAPVRKAAEALDEDSALSVAPGDEERYVSRGGLKLAAALLAGAIDPTGLDCLDVGQSTGGFTDCLLQAGARRVVGIDVGHGQLHASLRDDPRVRAFEGINARSIDAATLGDAMPARRFALIVVDVSFISLALVLPALAALAASDCTLVALVKPQFEVGREGLDKRGVVRDPEAGRGVRERIGQAAHAAGWAARNWIDSPIAGGDGNREFLLVARRANDAPGADTDGIQR